MEALKEAPKVAASTYSHTNPASAEKLLREHSGAQELIAWIGIAAIWAIGALAIYVLWVRVTHAI
jgi:hypothetical protein